MADEVLLSAVARAVAERFEDRQVPFLRALVEQPSCTREPEDVEAAACLVDAAAGALGMTRALHPDPEGRYADHRVFATAATAEGERAPVLVGHVDTVFPRSLGFLGFRRDGDVVRGPGVLDMKSGLSAILFALEAVRDASPETFGALRLRFVCNCDEEVGSPSSRALFEELAPRTTEALVFEAGREADRIVTRRKGVAVFRIAVTGRSAHAGNHHAQGVSAVHALALLVPRLEALTDYDRGVTVNVGLFEGGTAKNTVPEHAWCEIDARFVHAPDGDALVAAIRELVAAPELPERLAGVQIALTGGITRPPMEPNEASQALRARYEAQAAAVGLGVGEAPIQGGGSDANLLAAAGVPCIDGLGPAGAHSHRVEEWSSLSSLLRRTQALARLLAHLGEGSAQRNSPRGA